MILGFFRALKLHAVSKSVSKHLLRTCCVQGPTLGGEDTMVTKAWPLIFSGLQSSVDTSKTNVLS